jgi:RNA polymerase sigma-70 factor (ECF subfamily)
MVVSPNLVNKYSLLLKLHARTFRLAPKLQARFEVEDIVQEALARALTNLHRFCGTTEAEFYSWLKQILHNTFLDLVAHEVAKKRDPEMEAALNHSSARLDQFLADQTLSPSMKAELREVELRLAEAIDSLAPDQREVVLMRDLHKMPLKEIAATLNKSVRAVAGLLRRGREELQTHFPDYRETRDDV